MWNLVLTGISGILLGVLLSMDRSFPAGLYEEKLLERVIRVEILLKDTLEKITETNVRIKEDSIKLHEALHAQFGVMKQGLYDNVKAFIDTAKHNMSTAAKEMNYTTTERACSYLHKVESFIAATKNITATCENMNSTITPQIATKCSSDVEILLQDALGKITETNVRIKEDNAKLNEAIHAQLKENMQRLYDNVKAFIDTATNNVSGAVKEMNSTMTALACSYLEKVESFVDAATNNITATCKKINSTITSQIATKGNIDVEILLKDTLEKITETNVRIKEDNAKLNEAIHTQLKDNKRSLHDNVKAFIDTATYNVSGAVKEMNSTMTSIACRYLDKVESFIDAATKNITATCEKLNSTITSRIEGQSGMHQVTFNVRRTAFSKGGKYLTQYKYDIRETLVFDEVINNEGGGYDPRTGNFMALEAGMYMFTLQYFSIRNYKDFFQIVKEGKVLPKSMQATGLSCMSVRAFAMLGVGDKVWARSTSEDEVEVREHTCMHSFSGMIVRV